MITLIIGGARSGKSNYAEEYCLQKNSKPAYIATAQVFDTEMEDRVKKHRQRRENLWDNYEEPYNVSGLLKNISEKYEVILLDCLTVYITNLMLLDYSDDLEDPVVFMEKKEAVIKEEVLKLVENNSGDTDLVIVSNEVGLGIVPENFLARTFRDINGRMNQYLAEVADQVFLTVAGIPIKIKPEIERIIR